MNEDLFLGISIGFIVLGTVQRVIARLQRQRFIAELRSIQAEASQGHFQQVDFMIRATIQDLKRILW